MTRLKFSFNAEALQVFHGVITCLARFKEEVFLEARKDTLTLSALNNSKSAYASFSFDVASFFKSYTLEVPGKSADARFTCRLQNKALAPVFRNRSSDARDKDAVVHTCKFMLRDDDGEAQSRFEVKMMCSHGVTKTYQLIYDKQEIMSAIFRKERASNVWKMSSRILKGYADYFGQKTEQLSIFAERGRVTFTSFTDKVLRGSEILKAPVSTAVSAEMDDFEEFNAEERVHIIIPVKDFKSVMLHADSVHAVVTARYSGPGQPLQFSYSVLGMLCEFTLMSGGEDTSESTTPSAAASFMSTRTTDARTLPSAVQMQARPSVQGSMPPPAASMPRQRSGRERPLGKQSTQSLFSAPREDSNSNETMFVPLNDDDDRRWDPADEQDDNNGDDMLRWDASAVDPSNSRAMLRDTAGPSRSTRNSSNTSFSEGVPPTQRLSEIRGIFD